MLSNIINEDLYKLLYDVNVVSITLRLTLASLIGFLIGAERGSKGKGAGIKTHILVCLGSAMTMLLSQYLVEFLNYSLDVSRLSAQVISGIGFLGAGTILVTGHNKIVGLSTAAGLWTTACVGLVIGIGFYELVIIGCTLVILVFRCIPRLEEKIYQKNKHFTIYTEFNSEDGVKKAIEVIKSVGCKIDNINIGKSKISSKTGTAATIEISMVDIQKMEEVLLNLGKINGISFLEKV